MKIISTLLTVLFLIGAANADDSKYISAMKKNLAQMDSNNTLDKVLDQANSFERIALAEKDKWLPYYYASLNTVLACFMDTTTEKKDIYLDKADNLAHIADSLKPNESEIYTLRGMIDQGRLQIDPMNRWQKYGQESTDFFQQAAQLDTLNPRPDYLMGTSVYYTPEQFGGGPKAAKPYFELSLSKFEKFVPKDELMPNWGKSQVVALLAQIK